MKETENPQNDTGALTLSLALDRPLVVFDIESTGVNARLAEIIENAPPRR